MDWEVDQQVLAKTACEFAEQIHARKEHYQEGRKTIADRANCKRVVVRKSLSGMMALE